MTTAEATLSATDSIGISAVFARIVSPFGNMRGTMSKTLGMLLSTGSCLISGLWDFVRIPEIENKEPTSSLMKMNTGSIGSSIRLMLS